MACTPCDCLNDCGDDPLLRTAQVAKCHGAICHEAARRAKAWQEFEAWWTTPESADRGAPMHYHASRDTAQAAWFAAKRSRIGWL